jgi:hypothetical protein
MSFGSRANQAKPEALVILFRANPETAFFCGRTQVCVRVHPDFLESLMEIFFSRAEPGPAPSRKTVLHLPCA